LRYLKTKIEAVSRPELTIVRVERNSAVSVYRQIADQLRKQILADRFASNAPLPTERELMIGHDVSRVTVRLAMDLLEDEGLIVRQRGKGTFVKPRRVRNALNVPRGFYDALLASGLKVEVQLLKLAIRTTAREPGLNYDSILYLERLYLNDGRPLAVSRSRLHAKATSLQRDQVEYLTNFEILSDLLGLEIERAELTVRGRIAGARTASALHIKTSAAVLDLHRTTYGSTDQILGRSVFSVPADRFEFGLAFGRDEPSPHALRPFPPVSTK
jgi:GntR family transcriptional regulator